MKYEQYAKVVCDNRYTCGDISFYSNSSNSKQVAALTVATDRIGAAAQTFVTWRIRVAFHMASPCTFRRAWVGRCANKCSVPWGVYLGLHRIHGF